ARPAARHSCGTACVFDRRSSRSTGEWCRCGLHGESAAVQDRIFRGLWYSDRRTLSWSASLLQFTRFWVKKNLTEINHKVSVHARGLRREIAGAFAAKCAAATARARLTRNLRV